MAPVVDEVKKKYKDKVIITQIDIDKEENKAEVDKYGVRSIPAFIFLDGEGKQVKQAVGAVSKEQLESQIESLLAQS